MKTDKLAFLEELNPQQREAVEATEGPVLVLAGAGSGKTRVLTCRIANLIAENRAAPWEILAMTFTNKAAREMKERIKDLLGGQMPTWIGTFHSLFSKILRIEAAAFGYTSNFVIYDSDDQERLIKTILVEMGISPKAFAPRSIGSVISKQKNSLIEPEAYQSTVASPFENVVARVYPVYEQRLRLNQACDFDDLITLPIKLFNANPAILEKYQSRFKYVLVDEYQDTNRAQYLLLKSLSAATQNLCAVGDDDQSIYRWRGADLRNILDFEDDYPDAKVFRLEQNYRSTTTILQTANAVIEHNQGRKGKKLWSDRNAGDKVTVIEATDERHEAQLVVDHIKDEVFKHKRDFRDFAILYRTNAQSRSLEEVLRRSGMSYLIVGGVRFYERKEIKDILAYLKLIVNPMDSISLKRIINFPLRGIGETSVKKIETQALERGIGCFEALGLLEEMAEISPRIRKNAANFHQLIQKYIDLKDKISLNELVRTIVDETGILAMFKEDATVEGQGRADNIREFLSGVKEYVEINDEPRLSGFLDEVALVSDIDTWSDRSNAITLMTLHSAKGLEFPVVFITGLEEGLLPVSRSLDEPESVEEERRLFYVGLTRAKDSLYVTYAERRRRYNDWCACLPSRFVDEMDKTLLRRTPTVMVQSNWNITNRLNRDFQLTDTHPDYASESQEATQLTSGMWMMHRTFGKGQVVSVEGHGEKVKATLKFEDGSKKKFIVKYAQLTPL